jgi:cytochrome P450
LASRRYDIEVTAYVYAIPEIFTGESFALQVFDMPNAIDLLDHSFRANPYPHYADWREHHPVIRVAPGNLWAISRYQDIKNALRDHQSFSSRGFSFILNPPWLSDSPQGESMLAKDPPEHGRLRALVSKAFTPKVLDNLAAAMENSARDLVDQLLDRRQIELLEDFNFPYISQVVGRIVGFDATMHVEIKRWVDLLNHLGPEKPPPDIYCALEESQARISSYATEVIRQRKQAPQEDLLSKIIQAEVDGHRLSDRECLSMLELLIGAAFDTTNVLLTNCIRQLCATPGLIDTLHKEPELVPAYIEEVMRYDPPTHALLRQASQDVTVAGTTIASGEFVYLMLGSAGRDSHHYSNPDAFDLHRDDHDHLSFGHGIHVCVGMMLARMEVRIALRELIDKFKFMDCPPPEDIDWASGVTSRGVEQLPLTLSLR